MSFGRLHRVTVRRKNPGRVLGTKVQTTKKLQLAEGIADSLGIPRPTQSRGSSIDSTFLDRIHVAISGNKSTTTDAYRKAERVLQDLGLTYDPFWDTSESAGETGGSTVTNRAYSRILSAVTHTPRCFIVNVNDAEVGARWETDHAFRYAYDSTVSGRANFTDAGPGSRIIYYATHKHKKNPMHFIAHAEVTYIGPGWTGPWEARIDNYTEFTRPVPKTELEMAGWNTQISITEITFDTYEGLLRAADSSWVSEAADEVEDPGGEVVAQRVLDEVPPLDPAPPLLVPSVLPTGIIDLQPPAGPTYREAEPGTPVTSGDLPPTSKNVVRNKLAETRAVDLVKRALAAQGWALKRDCQKDGVGYDLHYVKGARHLLVEVKGIIGDKVAFNLTPREAWRIETDPDFVLIAVTNVLSPAAYELNLLTRDQLAQAQRLITGYRMTL